MKIAICFSGHMREMDRTLDQWSTIDADIFIHTWNNIHKFPYLSGRTVPLDINKVKRFYNPKVLCVDDYELYREMFEEATEPYKQWQRDLGGGSRKVNACTNYYSMYHKMYECGRIVPEEYDFIIRSRTDLLLNEDLTQFLDPPENTVYTIVDPSGKIRSGVAEKFVNDIFIAGRRKEMDKVQSLIKHWDKRYNAAVLHNDPEAFYNPHLLLYYHLEDVGVKFIAKEINYSLLRHGD